METTIILCFITYIGFETVRFGEDSHTKYFGLSLFFLGLVGLFGRLLGNLS